MIKNILEGRKLSVYGKGDNIRDWIFVEDNCKGIDLVLREAKLREILIQVVSAKKKNKYS